MYSPEQRLVIVTNPNSMGNAHVESEVIQPLNDRSISYHHIMTKYPDAEANIEDLAGQLRDDDRIITAVGDGTVGQVANAVLLSERDVEVGALPYGNFNDIATTHTQGKSVIDLISADSVDVIPIDVSLDDEHWRYAVAYFSIGWTAVASAEFSSDIPRSHIRNLPRSLKLGKSLIQIVELYFKHRHDYLPPFHTSESNTTQEKTTDIVAVNTPRAVRLVRGIKRYYDSPNFGYKEANISRILPNLPFLAQAFTGLASFTPLARLDVTFENETVDVPIQTEGEAKIISANKISIEKDPSRILRILHT